jgi:hypothetical protein
MEKEAKLIELRDRSGGLIFTFFIVEKSFQEAINEMKENKENPAEKREEKPKESNNNQHPKGSENPLAQDSLMSDAQKRYLFRILVEQGKEGEEAHEYLKNRIFQVKSLKEVTKFEASQAIERLLAGSKGGA